MPYCVVTAAGGGGAAHTPEEEVRIFYQRYGHGATKVLLIIGFAGTYESWAPQVKGLSGALEPVDEEDPADDDDSGAAEGVEVCCFDNRGMGRSSVPEQKSQYTTTIMAKDALALMDHLGWRKAHVFGHSMGAMVASKLAAMAPDRVASLALLNTTGGGYQCIPKVDWHTISLAYRFLRETLSRERFSTLKSIIRRNTLRKLLDHVPEDKCFIRYGFEGQMNACWAHKLSTKELDRIRLAGFLVLIIHGRDDIVAQLYYARRLAEKLQPAAKLIELHGGHLVSHERPAEVTMSLMDMIKASKSSTDLDDWSTLPKKSDAGSLRKRDGDMVNYLMVTHNLLGKLQLIWLFLFGVFYFIVEHVRRIQRVLKPVRVSASTE